MAAKRSIYREEERAAAEAWINEENRTGQAARHALKRMGFTGHGSLRAHEAVESADYWADRISEDEVQMSRARVQELYGSNEPDPRVQVEEIQRQIDALHYGLEGKPSEDRDEIMARVRRLTIRKQAIARRIR